MLLEDSNNTFNLSSNRLIIIAMDDRTIQYDVFFVDPCGRKMKIKFKDLVYVESCGNYILLVGNDFKTIVYSSLTGILKRLEVQQFIRIHKSYIISIEYMEAIKGNECIMNLNRKKANLPIGCKTSV